MPHYVRKHGQGAKEEEKQAIKLEKERESRRATLNAINKAEKEKALRRMEDLEEVRWGKKIPPESAGTGYSDPQYTAGCWKAYVVTDDGLDESQWKWWSVKSKGWLNYDEDEQAHSRDERVDHDRENEVPQQGIKRQGTMDTLRSMVRRVTGGLGGPRRRESLQRER